jgi:hypothetical protein
MPYAPPFRSSRRPGWERAYIDYDSLKTLLHLINEAWASSIPTKSSAHHHHQRHAQSNHKEWGAGESLTMFSEFEVEDDLPTSARGGDVEAGDLYERKTDWIATFKKSRTPSIGVPSISSAPAPDVSVIGGTNSRSPSPLNPASMMSSGFNTNNTNPQTPPLHHGPSAFNSHTNGNNTRIKDKQDFSSPSQNLNHFQKQAARRGK